MNKNEVLKTIKKEFNDVDDNILLEVIDKYDYIINVLYDAGLTSNYFYKTRWDHLTVFDFKCLFDDLINLRKKEGFFILNPSLLITYSGWNVDSVDGLIIRLNKILYDDNWLMNYYKEFDYYLFSISDNNRLYNLISSSYISSKEKNILSLLMKIFEMYGDGKEETNWHYYSPLDLLNYAYIYFKINNMIEDNYKDIMNFIKRVKNDYKYLNHKLLLNEIDDINELLNVFESYYHEPKVVRKTLK